MFDYPGGGSPAEAVRSILTAGYGQAIKFAAGQLRSSTLSAGRTIGYADDGVRALIIMLTLPGDADLNGRVDFADFVLLQAGFGTTNTTFGQGNFDYNNVTDFADFVLLQANFGQALSGRASITREQYAAVMGISDMSQVPEPTAVGLAGLVVTGLLRRSRETG